MRRRRRALAIATVLAALLHGLLGGALRASGAWPTDVGTTDPALEVVGILTLTDPPPVAAPAAPPVEAVAVGAPDRLQAVPVPPPAVAASAPAAAEPTRPPVPDRPVAEPDPLPPPPPDGRTATASAPEAASDAASEAVAAASPAPLEPSTAASDPAATPSRAEGPPPPRPAGPLPTTRAATAAATTSGTGAGTGATTAAGTATTTVTTATTAPSAAAGGLPSADAGLSAGAPPFEWPPSTRVTYDLTGWYRGEVQGRAQVEWVRDGDRYAVQLQVAVGLPVAPLMSRRMASQGRITAQGLAPERYDEVTEVALREPRRATMAFTPLRARLADGRELPVPPGVQDTASQFIQMAYRFATEPGLADAGRVLELPLALPRRIDTWVYDVTGPVPLATPFGTLTAVHVRPRPPASRGDVLTAEAWFAPGLRWLPVRIRIRQDADTHVDLLIARLPDLLAREAEGAIDRSRTAPPPALREPTDPSTPR